MNGSLFGKLKVKLEYLLFACVTRNCKWLLIRNPILHAGAKILYKLSTTYVKIWDDSGSGADDDVSIWRAYSNDEGYLPLGATAVGYHSSPGDTTLVAKAVEGGALAHPTGFSEVWNDRGSGADDDVRVMSMNAPTGYTCIGHVAVEGYSNLPNANHYW